MRVRARGKSTGRRSFSLIELLVVLISIALIAVVSLPRILQARQSAKVSATIGNARMIYTCLMAADLDRFMAADEPIYPTSRGPDRTSTAYFQRMLDANVIPAFASLFAAPGLAYATNGILTAANNAWKITLDVNTNSPLLLPVLFTRNIDTPQSRLDPNNAQELLRSESPFGNHAAVIVQYAGSTLKLSSKTMKLFNPCAASNGVLAP